MADWFMDYGMYLIFWVTLIGGYILERWIKSNRGEVNMGWKVLHGILCVPVFFVIAMGLFGLLLVLAPFCIVIYGGFFQPTIRELLEGILNRMK